MKFEYSARSQSFIAVAICLTIFLVGGLLWIDNFIFFTIWILFCVLACYVSWNSVFCNHIWTIEINNGYLSWFSPSGPKTSGRIKLEDINYLKIQSGDGLIVSLTDTSNNSISMPQNCFHDLKNIVNELEKAGVKIINC